MKRALLAVVLVAATWLGVDALGDLTQSRPDVVDHDAVTEVVIEVREERFGPGEAAAAAALWAVCSAQTQSRAEDPPESVGSSRYRVVLAPAVGEHERRKLVGCLDDFTVDRVRGHVESFETHPR